MAREEGRTAQGTVGQRGFTLVELLIVIVVLAILVGIAYPSYQNYVTKSRRADAKSMLSQVASRQEQFFLNNKTYSSSVTVVWAAGGVSEAGYYTLGITDQDGSGVGEIATGYRLSATPVVGGPQAADSDCLAFRLDSRGNRDVTGSAPPEDCW